MVTQPGVTCRTMGPNSNSLFARLTTLSGSQGLFEGRVALAGSSGPESFPFSFPIGVPEPSGLALACLGVIGLITRPAMFR